VRPMGDPTPRPVTPTPLRIAVTGASGFVGGRIARALEAEGHRVHTYGLRPAARLAHPLPDYRPWDLRDPPPPLPPLDVLVHCGARVGQWGDEAGYRAANVEGTARLLGALPPQVRVVHVSSSSVYGVAEREEAIHEDEAGRGALLTAYARTKAASEALVLDAPHPSVVLRPHAVYGPGDTTLWPRVRAAVRWGGLLPVPGRGTNPLSVTHVDNLVDAVRLALAPGAPTGAFNVADGVVPTVDELLRTLFARRGLEVRLRYISRGVAWPLARGLEAAWEIAGALRHAGAGQPAESVGEPPLTRYAVASLADPFVLDLSRATEILGYRPRWSFRDGPLDE
jgi:2-alkyl-3-oxoalkanoate reductase